MIRVSLVVALLGGTATVLAKRKKKQPEQEPTPAVEAPPPPPTVEGMFGTMPPATLQTLPQGLANPTAQACNACHYETHDAWSQSAHANAGNSLTFREAMRRSGGSAACLSCHYPLMNQHAEITAAYKDGEVARPVLQPNEGWDPSLMAEGVTCAACHIREGYVVSTEVYPEAPHPMAIASELSTSEFCASCHQLTWPGADKPLYDTYGEWSQSGYAKAGIQCQTCHMSSNAGKASHHFSAETGRALSVLLDLGSNKISRGEPTAIGVRVQNTGAGHHFPTGSPFKAAILEIVVVDEAGNDLSKPHQHRFARTIEDAPPWATTEDTRLAAGSETTFQADLTVSQKKKAGHGAVVVRVAGEGAAPDETTLLVSVPITIL